MFVTCNCGSTFSVSDKKAGQFVDCPQCGRPRLASGDAIDPRRIESPQTVINAPVAGADEGIAINTELPPLTFWSSNQRIAVDAENGTLTFGHCFIPAEGFWSLRVRPVESYTCSVFDLVKTCRYQTEDEEGRVTHHTEIVTNAGRAKVATAPSKRSDQRTEEDVRDEKLRNICQYLCEQGYAEATGVSDQHATMVVIFVVLAILVPIVLFAVT
jgi:DNA-directed RNA polymerase subunit RPC12/RpoP